METRRRNQRGQVRRRSHLSGVTTTTIKGKKKRITGLKIFVYALALAAFGGAGYLVFERLRRRKKQKEQEANTSTAVDTPATNYTARSAGSKAKQTNDAFPLKRGSKGNRIMQLQQALQKTMPSLKADGSFGVQTIKALKAAGYEEMVDEQTFNKITGVSETAQVVFDPSALAKALYKAVQGKNLNEVLSKLKQIKSVQDYASVNEYYKKQSFIAKTIVNDLLEYAFRDDDAAKAELRSEFQRIGLRQSDSGQWSLQGIRLYRDLITIRPTVVTDAKGNRIPVLEHTILGDEIEVSSGLTWFKSIDNTILRVPSQDVKYA